MMRRLRRQTLLPVILLLLSLVFSSCASTQQVTAPSFPVAQNETDGTGPRIPEFSASETEQTGPAADTESEMLTEPSSVEMTFPTEATPDPIQTEPVAVDTETVPEDTVPPAKPDLTVNFSRDDWKRINIFLSNFSEIGFDDYDEQEDGYAFDLLYYGYLHLLINDSSKLNYDEYSCSITQADMDKCLTRFFGKSVPAGSYRKSYGDYTSEIDYRNGAFWFPAGAGEAYNYLTVVYRMQETDRNSYLVWFDVFELDLDEYFDRGISESYYSMTYSEAVSSSKLSYCYTGMAEVRDYVSGSFQSYQLISYDVD